MVAMTSNEVEQKVDILLSGSNTVRHQRLFELVLEIPSFIFYKRVRLKVVL